MQLQANPYNSWPAIPYALIPLNPPLSDAAIAAAFRASRQALKLIAVEPTAEAFFGAAREIEAEVIRRDAVKRQESLDIACYQQVRFGALRMELLEEAFRKNLDEEPIFTAIATAATSELLMELRTVLDATPKLTLERNFDRALEMLPQGGSLAS